MRILSALRRAAFLAYIMGVGAPVAMSGQAQALEPASPSILAGDLLYVSGQGAQDAQGRVPREPAAQIRQCLSKVKTIMEAAGLTMEHVVYVQVYLTEYTKVKANTSQHKAMSYEGMGETEKQRRRSRRRWKRD